MITVTREGDRWVLRTEQRFPRSVNEVWPFFADAFNLEAITPPYLKFEVVTPAPIEMAVGTLIDYRLKLHGIPFRWRTQITAWEPPHRFVDEQVKGPYTLWRHEHRFVPEDDGTTLATDRVEYRIPGGPLARLANAMLVRRDVRGVFAYRHEQLARRFGTVDDAASASDARHHSPAQGQPA